MNKHLKNYLDSFKVKKQFWQIFLIDFIFFSVIGIVYYTFSNYLQNRSFQVLGGKTSAELQNLLTTSTPEKLLPFLTELKSFLFFSLVMILIIVILSFLYFSYTRALIWNHLENKKLNKKTYWRWNLLNLSLIFPLLSYIIVATIITFITSWLFSKVITISPTFYVTYQSIMEGVTILLNGIVSFFLVLFFLIILFFTYKSFTQKYRIWESIGHSFQMIKQNWSKLWKFLLQAIGTALLLTLIMWPLRTLYASNFFFSVTINMIISLLYLAWFRIYLLKTIE
ncbi:hypothetical protein COY27_05735 [Candidatus Woesearchaeota archaeon CG_4_10_14_0_2_um_filter_33_13]|nr:MAG: hypothetical protein COY27_05735 [Candidatus Woesearchaeota archaeon CG_4_10_14_0_2_um_filter_33_13]